ncbi:unnamed protein product [Closterium sp. NIES-53]
MYLMTCTRPDLAYPLSILARYVAPGRHRPENMAAAKRVLRYLCSTSGLGLVLGGRRPRSTRSSSVLGSSCEAEIYAGAMAAQDLRWLTYLLTDLGEHPRSPPVLYVDNKAMLALCREHRLEHRTKHIALRYFLARELQQRGHLRLAYVASQANTADIFTKALPPGDHQPCFALLDWSCFPTCTQLISSSIIPVSSHSCEAEIYAGAMAAQELRWLTHLLTDLGEPPRSPPVLYEDNKAMLALCREQRLEHRTKHIALRYFLARELQQSGQLRLAYVASKANTADVFTKALAPSCFDLLCLTGLLVDFAAACRLDYAASLVAESASASFCPPSVGGECALGTDVLEDRQEDLECFAAASPHLVSMLLAREGDPDALDIPTPRSYAEAIAGPYSSQWQAAMDAEMASGSPQAPTVKRPPGSPPAFKARYVACGFSQRQGVDFFQTFSPTPKMTTLRVLLHVAAQRDYELHSLDFSTAFLQGSLHEEIWLRRPPGFTGSFPAGTQWSLRRPVYGLRQAPREWYDMLRTTLAALGFASSTADPSLFLRTDATLPPLYVLVYVDDLVFATADTEALAHVKSELQKRHTCTDLGELTSYLGLQITRDRAQRTITLTQSHMVQQVLQRFGFTYSSPKSTPLPTGQSLSAPPSNESVEQSGPYPELVGCLMYLMTCTRPDLAYPLSLVARYVAPGRHRKVHWDAAKRVLRYLYSTSGMGLVLGGRARVVLTGHADASWLVLACADYTPLWLWGSSCEAEIYAGAMAAQELRWLTYLLTDLGEAPRSPPVVYVDNKAMLALCQEHRLEHRTKHIALRYFLARELQQRGQLRLAYVASQANTADVFTKALQPCDHQRFCTVLGLVPTVPHLLTS